MSGVSASGSITIGLGTGTGSGQVAASSIVTTGGGFSLTGDQYSDVTLNNVTASASITVNMAGSGSITASSLNTAGALSITKALGSEKLLYFRRFLEQPVSITLGAGSGHLSARQQSIRPPLRLMQLPQRRAETIKIWVLFLPQER